MKTWDPLDLEDHGFSRNQSVHCKTKSEAAKLLKFLSPYHFYYEGPSEVYKWLDYWDTYQERTTYFVLGKSYADIGYSEKHKTPVMTFEEFSSRFIPIDLEELISNLETKLQNL